jgi:hypothetical protein
VEFSTLLEGFNLFLSFHRKKKKKKLNGVDKEQTIAYFRGIFLAIWK